MVTNLAYRFLITTAGVFCDVKFGPDDIAKVCPNRISKPRKILVAAMLAYEVDTLQIALHEYDGLADVLLSENLNPHNPRATGAKPFYAWPRLKGMRGFTEINSTIFWQGCKNKRTSSETYEAEDLDEWCETNKIKALTTAHDYDVVVVGSVDEVLARREMIRLKWCKDIPQLPTKGAIGMPMGLIGRSFRSDFPPRGMPWAFAMPNVYGKSDALAGVAKRNLGNFRDREPIVGGLHLTNYCFLPAMILKEMWTSDYGHNLDTVNPYQSLAGAKQRCYDNFKPRIKYETGAPTVVPRLLQACPDQFPAWHGKIDAREQQFHELLKRNSHSQ